MAARFSILLALTVGVGACGSGGLSSGEPETRLRTLILMDREALLDNLARVEFLARHDPDPDVRREAIRNLGWTRDPSVLPVLDGLIGTEWGDAAAESLRAYGGSEGCERVRRLAAFDGPRIVDPAHDPDGSRSARVRAWLFLQPCPP